MSDNRVEKLTEIIYQTDAFYGFEIRMMSTHAINNCFRGIFKVFGAGDKLTETIHNSDEYISRLFIDEFNRK